MTSYLTNMNVKRKSILNALFRSCLLIVLVVMGQSAFAQNDYTRVAVGYNFGRPTLEHGYNTDLWQGVHVRSKFLEMGYMAAHGTDPEGEKILGYNVYLGGNFPLKRFAFGNRSYGIRGFLFQPFIAGSVGVIAVKGSSFEITCAPGASIQLPYTLIDFRLNAMVPFSGDKPGLKGFILMPTITFQLDALWDVMDPVLKFDAHHEGVNTNVTQHIDGDYLVTTTTYTPYSFDVYKYDVRPHISLGPRVCYWNLPKGQGNTFMTGLVQSGRAHGLGYDFIAEQGKITSLSGYDLKAARAIARLSFDLNVSHSGYTQFTRLMVGAGLGYNWFLSSDEHVAAKDGQFVNFFVSYELGAVSISYERNKAFYAAFDDQGYFAFTYRLPFERLIDRYKELNESRERD